MKAQSGAEGNPFPAPTECRDSERAEPTPPQGHLLQGAQDLSPAPQLSRHHPAPAVCPHSCDLQPQTSDLLVCPLLAQALPGDSPSLEGQGWGWRGTAFPGKCFPGCPQRPGARACGHQGFSGGRWAGWAVSLGWFSGNRLTLHLPRRVRGVWAAGCAGSRFPRSLTEPT